MLSQQLADFITKTKYEDLSKEEVQFTKGCIIDWLGSCVAGRNEKAVRILQDFVEEMGGHPQSSLVSGGKTSVHHAAFVNGASSHIVELDDIHRGSIVHAATVVIPAALAVAEYKKKSGKDLLTAVVIGYDVAFRIGEAVSPSHYKNWHNTATCGTFGAAAAVSKLLDLTEEQTRHALGTAGTQAAGLWEFIENGSMSKQLHPAKAGMEGVIASFTALKGFTGAERILEGNRGFFQAMSDDGDKDKITHELGSKFKITENSFKIHASCRHTHQPIDIALQFLKDPDWSNSNIEKIKVKTYQSAIDVAGNKTPQTLYAAKFSIEYCTALAFIKGKVNIEDFNKENLFNEEIRSLMDKVEVEADPAIEAYYPERWGTQVDVRFDNGKAVSKKVDYPKGDPENPVTLEELIEKFRNLTAVSGINNQESDQWIDQILNLEEVNEIADWFLSHSKHSI